MNVEKLRQAEGLTQAELLTWGDRLEKLNEVIEEGHLIMDRITGPQVKVKDERKESLCYADPLGDEIRVAEIEAGALVARLEDLARMF